MLRKLLLRRAEKIMASRPPDFEIGPPGDRYMQRWFITPWSRYERGSTPKNWWAALKRKMPNVYLHHFLGDDQDFALHDHPWWSCSFLLKNGYCEVIFSEAALAFARLRGISPAKHPDPTIRVFRREGSLTIRGAGTAHRIVLERTSGIPRHKVETISLFITGPVVRTWGFWCPQRWKAWKEFVNDRDYGEMGHRGCGED